MDISKIDWSNREQVLMAIKENPAEIVRNVKGDIENEVIEKIRADKEYMIQAVKQDGYLLSYASDELRNEKETVSTAITADNNGDLAVRSIGDELMNDKEFILNAMEIVDEKTVKDILMMANDELQNDKDVVLKAVGRNGFALKYASKEMKNDKDVVLKSVKQNGFAIEVVDEQMKNDKDVVLEAVKQNGFVLKDASEEMRNDKDVVMETINNLPSGIKIDDIDLCIGERLREDEEFIKEIEGILAKNDNEEEIIFDDDEIELDYDEDLIQFDVNIHTPEEIAEAISPRQSEIKEVVEEMVKEEIKEKDQVEKEQE